MTTQLDVPIPARVQARPRRGLVATAERLGVVEQMSAKHRWQTIGLQLLFIAVIAGIWQLLVSAHIVRKFFISSPVDVAQAFYHGVVGGPMLASLGKTLEETVVGFLIAAAAGVVSGLILHELPVLHRASRPFLTAANNLPRLALAPVFVIWFGIGFHAHVALVVSLAYFVVLLNTYAGLTATNRDHLVLARVAGASRWQTFSNFLLPAAVPTIFAGLQLALTYSLLGAVIGEMISGGVGLGADINVYQTTFATDKTFAALILLAIAGTVMSAVMRGLEGACVGWRRHELRGTGKT